MLAMAKPSHRLKQADALQLVGQAGAVGGVQPGHSLITSPGVAAETAAGEDSFARCQPADTNRAHIVWMLCHEVAVDRLVMLAIVADEQPFDLRELTRQAF